MPKQDTRTWPLSAAIEAFLTEPLFATLTTLRPDGTPHVVPVHFTWDSAARMARVMVAPDSRKVRNLIDAPGGRAALCQVKGRGWVTLEGTATVSDDPERVAEGKRRCFERYSRNTRGRVVIEIAVDRVMSRNI
ncbi:pyridoxamine 5'-phosphate oxidase family protein [Actinomadura luteofluorescens]|uniref:pyridoxamine 5'-phosphate oxidase family protein n=1 Tax=Actinomadura luteofluorescens TaxID=46163 RepID=UPI003469EA08